MSEDFLKARYVSWKDPDSPESAELEIMFGPNDNPPSFEIILDDESGVILTLDQAKKLVKYAEERIKEVEWSPRDAAVRQWIRKGMPDELPGEEFGE